MEAPRCGFECPGLLSAPAYRITVRSAERLAGALITRVSTRASRVVSAPISFSCACRCATIVRCCSCIARHCFTASASRSAAARAGRGTSPSTACRRRIGDSSGRSRSDTARSDDCPRSGPETSKRASEARTSMPTRCWLRMRMGGGALGDHAEREHAIGHPVAAPDLDRGSERVELRAPRVLAPPARRQGGETVVGQAVVARVRERVPGPRLGEALQVGGEVFVGDLLDAPLRPDGFAEPAAARPTSADRRVVPARTPTATSGGWAG